jgi:3-deoxy-manno-octulosonate cytidylyltransferase (CMP-KDO synthetase)
VAEVARRRPEHAVVVNLQGDEPELDAAAVARLAAAMKADPGLMMGTLAGPEDDPLQLASPQVVKVAVDGDGFALYFTREVRHPSPPARLLRHIGVYAFSRAFLLEFASWPPAEAERRERLEQLRALERGVRIRVLDAAAGSGGVDTPDQLAALERRGPV